MSCFDKLVTIRGENPADAVSESGLHINDHDELNLDALDLTLNGDKKSVIEELKIKRNIAAMLLVNDVRQYYLPEFRIAAIVDSSIVGFMKNNLPTQAAQAYLTGVNIEVDRADLLALHVSKIGLQVQADGSVNVVVWDLMTDTLLDTIPVSAVAKTVVYVDVSKVYKTQAQKLNIFIGYNATALGSYETTVNRDGNCLSCSGGYSSRGIARVKGAKIATGSAKIDSNLESQTGTSGLTVHFSVNCDIENFVCKMRNVFAVPFWYKYGIVVIQQSIKTKRFNSSQYHKIDLNATEKKWEESYQMEMKTILENIRLPKNDCFICSPKVRSVVRLP